MRALRRGGDGPEIGRIRDGAPVGEAVQIDGDGERGERIVAPGGIAERTPALVAVEDPGPHTPALIGQGEADAIDAEPTPRLIVDDGHKLVLVPAGKQPRGGGSKPG